uniref:Myelin protein zero like 2 n=1 Tax=Anser cygnoides TaxID=8845 RepID=A0A8B9EAD6_ANSCY
MCIVPIGKSLSVVPSQLGIRSVTLWPITALEVYTSKEVDALNGTNLRLKCTFSSSSPISPQLSVTWNFQPEDLNLGPDETVFYYLKEPYKLSAGRFKGRATWDGNIERYDVSIVIWNLQPTDNGTFTCQVKNPPDVDGTIGEVRLRVVQKGERPRTPPEVMSLASAEHQLVFLHVWKNVWKQKERERLLGKKACQMYLHGHSDSLAWTLH